MAENRGGYRKPNKPAPVSGPGKLSKRTDGGPAQKIRELTGGKYGEGKAFTDLEASAPMAAADTGAPTPPAPSPQGGPPSAPVDVIPFGAATQSPDEPVTAGNPLGAGVGPAAMGLQDPMQQIDQQDAQRLVSYLPALEFISTLPGSSSAMRAYVRYIKALAT